MNLYTSIICLIIPLSAWSQAPDLPRVAGKVNYTEIITVDSVTTSELFIRARTWYAKTFNSAKDVIQMENGETIVGKALLPLNRNGLHSGSMHYTVTLSVKEGKYRYEFTDFYHTNASNPGGWGPIEGMFENTSTFNRKTFNGFMLQTDKVIQSLITSLKESMSREKQW